jgi:hypothetical protein
MLLPARDESKHKAFYMKLLLDLFGSAGETPALPVNGASFGGL